MITKAKKMNFFLVATFFSAMLTVSAFAAISCAPTYYSTYPSYGEVISAYIPLSGKYQSITLKQDQSPNCLFSDCAYPRIWYNSHWVYYYNEQWMYRQYGRWHYYPYFYVYHYGGSIHVYNKPLAHITKGSIAKASKSSNASSSRSFHLDTKRSTDNRNKTRSSSSTKRSRSTNERSRSTNERRIK